MPSKKILSTLNALKDSTKSVYPEYYVIFQAGLESLRVYRTPVVNSVNACKNYILELKDPIMTALVAGKDYAFVNFNNVKEYLSVLYKFFVE